ncbi:MAG TPA: DUF389 domain-containing protein [Anaerolineae bacterium]
MRQLIVKVPRGCGQTVIETAEKHDAVNLAQVNATDDGEAWDLVFVNISNHDVGSLLDDLESLPEVHLSLFPHGVLTMSPPKGQVSKRITSVHPRSPIEVWLGGLQSIGSWKSFMGYALAASVVVWIGMFTNTIYLLVAAMLIAPFAGPAMNLALATARGDKMLLWRSLVRYFLSLLVTIAATALLSLLLQIQTPTSTMISVSEVSSFAILLPIVAGAAGAMNLVEADRNSLVSGAAVGMLIAASLAPPAGLVGMASALGRWDMALGGAFLLLLQLLGINIAGSVVFRLYGLKPSGPRYKRGKSPVFYTSIALSIVLLIGMLAWQFRTAPTLQRSTQSQRALAIVQEAVSQSELGELVEANLRFTRSSVGAQNTLLGIVYVQRQPGVTLPAEQIRQELTRQIQQRILDEGFNVAPLIDVSVLEPPPKQ